MPSLPAPISAIDEPACQAAASDGALRRRALARQYKRSRPVAGVFTVTNQANGRVFVGGSLQLESAINRMRFELKFRSHRNLALQQDWISHGPDAFCFAVVDEIKERDDPSFDYRAELESMLTMWREEIPCRGERGYNGAAP